MKKQAEKIEITDDIIRNKFYEILNDGGKKEREFKYSDSDDDSDSLVEDKTPREEVIKEMGFDNINDYSSALDTIKDESISEEDKSLLNAKIKRYEFLRENFVQEVKNLIKENELLHHNDPLNSAYRIA